MARLLSDAEIAELTGYVAPGKQIESIRKLGVIPVIRPDGRPRVTDDAITQAMLGNVAAPDSARAPESTPDWTALRKSA